VEDAALGQSHKKACAQGEKGEMPVAVPVMADDSEGRETKALAWFLAGAILGAAIAMVFAPRSGKETRQFLTEKAQEGKERVAEGTQDVIGAGRDMFERGRKLVEDAADLFDRGRRLMRGDTSADS
jgi:gas vesicle protein